MATSIIKAIPLEEKTLTTSSLNHLESATAKLYRKGNVGVIAINAKNTEEALAVGSDASFTISGLPPIAYESKGLGYSGSSALVVTARATQIAIRVTGSQWTGGYTLGASVIVVFS